MPKRDNLIGNTKRALVKELRCKLIQLFKNRNSPAVPLSSGNNPERTAAGVRFDVFDVNYPDGADVYAITRWGDLVYSFPGEFNPEDLSMDELCKFDLPKGVYHDLTPDDLYIEGISMLIARLEQTYSI